MADKHPVPPHVLKPASTTKFVVATKHPATKTAGLGYAILRALGAHDRLGPVALDIVSKWSPNPKGERSWSRHPKTRTNRPDSSRSSSHVVSNTPRSERLPHDHRVLCNGNPMLRRNLLMLSIRG